MLVSAKNKYKLLIDPEKDLFRWKVDAYPALIYAVCCGMTRSPYGWPVAEGFFLGHDFYWFNNWQDIWGHGNRFIKDFNLEGQQDLPDSYYQKFDRVFKELEKRLKALDRIDFSKINQKELRREWFKFFNFYTLNFWVIVTDSEVLSYAASHRMEEEIAKSGIKLLPSDISQLTVFPEKSFLMAEEYDLLKIALVKSKERRRTLLSRHAKKFSWLLNGYHGAKKLDEDFFTQRFHELLKDGRIASRLKYFKNYYRQTNQKFNNLVHKYRLNSKIISYAKLAQRATYLQDQRKMMSFRAMEYIVRMYDALARHLQITREESLYILWSEFDSCFRNRSIISEIAKRRQCCRLRIMRTKTVISLNKTKSIFKLLEDKYSSVLSSQIAGVVAYSGKVRGYVKIVQNRQEIADFRTGQILVSLMTSPDYIIAIKKSKAIITDDGGLTCHASIVARELKKPCIVGTKIATKVLHDGDLVEVDADKGTVRLLKKSK